MAQTLTASTAVRHAICLYEEISVDTAVSIMKSRFFDLVPMESDDALEQAVLECSENISYNELRDRDRNDFDKLLATLTPREREVLAAGALGQSTKQIATSLGVRTRTIDVFRSTAKRKLKLKSLGGALRFNESSASPPS